MIDPWFLKEAPLPKNQRPDPERLKLYQAYLSYQLQRGAIRSSRSTAEVEPPPPPARRKSGKMVMDYLLENGEADAYTIRTELGFTEQACQHALVRLRRAGLAEPHGEDKHVAGGGRKWSLTPKGIKLAIPPTERSE